ncbi:hypothetical protein PTI98_002299 [Pleurotus ostreatus]|nr:hypothetical protein PTI98_002299 [Pleurotus ostreatus]
MNPISPKNTETYSRSPCPNFRLKRTLDNHLRVAGTTFLSFCSARSTKATRFARFAYSGTQGLGPALSFCCKHKKPWDQNFLIERVEIDHARIIALARPAEYTGNRRKDRISKPRAYRDSSRNPMPKEHKNTHLLTISKVATDILPVIFEALTLDANLL